MSHQKGGERIAMMHGKSKSYLEMDSSGNTVLRGHGDVIQHSGKNLRMSSSNHLEMATQKGALRMFGKDKIVMDSEGSAAIISGQGLSLSAVGNLSMAVGRNFDY